MSPSAPLGWGDSSAVLVFGELAGAQAHWSGTFQVAVGGNLSGVLLVTRLGLWDLRRKAGDKMPWSSHHVKGTYCPHDSPPLLMTLTAAVAGFVHWEVTLSPTFHTVLSGRKPLCTASIRGVGSHGDH